MSPNQFVAEIYCDLKARMTKDGYSLERRGSIDDLARIGLSLEQAVGKSLLFNGGADESAKGQPADIMFRGVVVKDPEWGYLAVSDAYGLYWRTRS